MKRQLQSIHSLLGHHNALAKLHRTGQQLQQLTNTIRNCLPSAVAHHLLACSYSQAVLTLYAENAAQATTLRLASHHLLQSLPLDQIPNLCQESAHDIRIRIKVVPQTLLTRKAQQRPALADSTLTLISELAETVIDPAIKDSLRRLSRRRTKHS